MKTGTLTFHAPNNNGSFFQAYALQTVLRDQFDIENKIINFYSDKQESQYAVFRRPHSIADLARNLISLLHYKGFKEKIERFEKMRSDHLKMTERYRTEKEVYDNLEEFEALICGSDQIWNTEARDFSEVYMLSDIAKKKITYAVSCGSHIEDVDKKQILDAANRFDFVSVREQALYNYLHSSKVDVTKVLDPTLLLKKQSYSALLDNRPVVEGSYIFLYTINYDDQILETARNLSKYYNVPIYSPFTGYSGMKCYKYGINILYNIGPAQFLTLVDQALITCSNSFHGIAFSIIFHKNFYRLCNIDTDGTKKRDDRIDGILDELRLVNRNICQLDEKFDKSEIDYTGVEERLQLLRDDSIDYLRKALFGEGKGK